MRVMPRKPKTPRTNPLALWRAEKGWTQEEMADELGIDRVTVARLEARKVLPKRYVRALNDLKAKNP